MDNLMYSNTIFRFIGLEKMMFKPLFIISLFTGFMGFGQSRYTLEQAEKSSDIQLIATFIKENPNHPKNLELKRKIAFLMTSNSSHTPSRGYNNTYKAVSNPNVGTSYRKSSVHTDSDINKQKTADLLNHIFNNDPNKKEVYISIVNKSQCDLELFIKGTKTYKLNIPAMKTNFILLDKGRYTFSSSVCGAYYNQNKNLHKDMEITLRN